MSSDDTTKVCHKCKLAFPFTREYFPRNRSNKSGLMGYCKACWRNISRQWRLKNRPPKREKLPDGYRKCSKCKQVLPATREFFSGAGKRGNGCNAYCKPCAAEAQKKYRKDNPDSFRKTDQKRQHKKRISARLRYQANPEVGRQARRLYVSRHPERVKASASKIRAKRVAAQGEYDGKDLNKAFKMQKGKCWWCGVKIKGEFEVDHRVPLSRGGSNWPSNIVISCKRCNRSKNSKLPHEWSDRLL